MTNEQSKKITENALNRLLDELAKGHSHALKSYLAVVSRFHKYSWGNCLMIFGQRPEATHVAGFHTWLKFGRHVRKGEKSIVILAPMVGRKRQNGDLSEDEQTRLFGFRAAHVFDISQTDGDPLPEFATVKGDPQDYSERVKQLVASQQITLKYSDSIAPAKGVSYGGQIMLLPDLPPAEHFAVLVHELAHELLHRGDRRKETSITIRETEAEAIAFVVCSAIGLDTNSASSDYIHLCSGDKETLMASLAIIQQTAALILEAVERSETGAAEPQLNETPRRIFKMTTKQNISTPSSDYRDLAVSQLVESPTNPRKRYNQTSLRELAESIRAQGVLVPLLVRNIGENRFEIIAGSRRFRSAQLAGAVTVPVRIVRLTDAEAIVAQVVENLQRENVHPLEEAQGFRALLDLPGQSFTIATIAAKSGKSPQYVAGRLKLTELIAEAAEAFLADSITLAHALLIAKLPATQQEEAFKAAFKESWMMGGQTQVLVPAKELAAWIESNLLLDLQAAPFDRRDASLVPSAGSCHDCRKRTGADGLLFPEADRDECLDRECYHGKVMAHIANAMQADPKLVQISTGWGSRSDDVLGRGAYTEILTKASRNKHAKASSAQKRCTHMTRAIFVEGSSVGQIIQVCAAPTCETHHADSRKAREAKALQRAEGRKQEEERKEKVETHRRMLTQILDRVPSPLAKLDLEIVARELIENLPQHYKTILCERHTLEPLKGKPGKPTTEIGSVLKGLDEAGYNRLLMETSLLRLVHDAYSPNSGNRFQSVAKRYRLDTSKITAAVAAEFAARRKERQERRDPNRLQAVVKKQRRKRG